MKKLPSQSWNEKIIINIVLLIIISWMSLWFLRFATTYPYGDGVEYVMMTEAIYNHGSPDFQKRDTEQYLNYLNKRNITIDKANEYKNLDFYITDINNKNLKYNKNSIKEIDIYALGKNNHLYSIHFWFYSTLAIPARALLHLLDANITKTFLLTNLCLFFIAIYLILKEKRLSLWKRLVLATLLGFSPAIWYMAWPHPELFGGVWVFMGLVYFFINRKILAVLILSLVAMQFPPVAFLAFFIIINILYEKRRHWSVQLFVKLFFAGIWVFLPIMFNLYNFNTTNIIMAMGYLKWDVVSFHRFVNFFFDPNQGVILAIPFLLLLLGFLFIIDSIKRKAWVGYFLISSIIIMSLFFMQMKNWNHGNEVINRYAVWVSSIIMVVVIFRLFKIKRKIILIPLLFLAISTQVFATIKQSNYKKIHWSASYFSPIGNYILTNYPQFYNPEPDIFRQRVNNLSVSTTDSVVVFSNSQRVITKMMVHTPSYHQLIARGMDSIKVETFKRKATKYTGDWFYINKTDFKFLGYRQSKDTLINQINKKNYNIIYRQIKEKIYNSPRWYNDLVLKAKKQNLPIEVIIERNIKYLINKQKK